MSPAAQKLENLPRSRPPGAIIDALEGQVPDQTSVQALEPFFAYYMSACEKGGADYTTTALGLFDELRGKKISPTVITFTSIIKTCFDNERYPEAMEKSREAVSKGVLSPLKSDAKVWDLHDLQEATACMLLADALLSCVESSKDFKAVRVVTGKGKHSTEDPVLIEKVPAFLRYLADLQLSEHVNERGKVNKGAFVITKKAFEKWAKSEAFTRFHALMTNKEKK